MRRLRWRWGCSLGWFRTQIAAGLERFRGVDRRFQIKGMVRGVTVVDDYGHHPTEIVATLQGGAGVWVLDGCMCCFSRIAIRGRGI